MRTCEHCGDAIKDTDRFCLECRETLLRRLHKPSGFKPRKNRDWDEGQNSWDNAVHHMEHVGDED